MENFIPRTIFIALLINLTTAGAALAESCVQKFSSDKTQLYQCDNIKLIRVQGSPQQRMQQLGSLHKKKLLSNDTLDYFAGSVEKQAGDSALLRGIVRTIYNLWVDDHDNQIPKSMKKELQAFIDSSGYSKSKYYRAMLLPDMGSYSTLLEASGTNNTNASFGCSSFAETSPSSIAFGRNLDFPGIHVYDKHPTITIHIPEVRSKEIAHVALASEGLYFGSISGFNQEGIFLAVHQNFSKDHSAHEGLPLYLVGETVLRSAHSLEEAIALLNKNRPLGMWTFLVGSLKDKKLAVVESSAKRFNYKIQSSPTFAQANHLRLTPDRDAIELLGAGDRYNSTFRIAKGLEILNEQGSSLEKVFSALNHQEQENGELNSTHDILKAETIHTFMLQAEQSIESTNLYMAMDGAPTASGRFLQLDWQNIWKSNPNYQIFSNPKAIAKRTIQSEMSEALYQVDEKSDYKKAISIMKNQQTYSARALRSSLYYSLGKFDYAKAELDQALQNQWQDIPSHMKESFWAMNALIAHKRGKFEIADRLLKIFFNLKPKNTDLLKTMKSLKSYNDLGLLTGVPSEGVLKEFTADYDFFSGDLMIAEGL